MPPQAEHVEDIPFTKQMRKATRDIHNISDALINAKLGIGEYKTKHRAGLPAQVSCLSPVSSVL